MTSLPLQDPTSLLADLDFVRSLARQLCHTVHTAEDVAQATLATAIESPPAKRTNWRGWLTTVTRNLARKHYRKEGRLKACEVRSAKSGTAPSTDQVVAREELRSSVVQAVLGLPDPYRKVVLLRHFNGLDMAECAASLGIPESTARTHLSRAVERLRGTLDRQHQGDRKAWMAALSPFALPTATTAHMVAAAAMSTNKKAVAVLLVAASLLAAWFSWPPGQAVAPPVASSENEQASVIVTEASSGTDANQPRASQLPSQRHAASVAAVDPWTATGTVTNADNDEALPGASVHLLATVGERHRGGKQINLGRVVTGPDGTFSVPIVELRSLTQIVQSQVFLYANIDAVGFDTANPEASLSDVLRKDENGQFNTELSPAIMTKGRVVTPAGAPVSEARLLLFSEEGRESFETSADGTFAFDIANRTDVVVYSMVIVHDQFGRSDIVTLRSDARQETRLGDIVLHPVGQRIEGFVHYPDGQPASGLEVSVSFEGDEELPPTHLNGLQIDNYEEALQGRSETITDERGRFVYHNVRYGTHEIDLDSDAVHTITVRAGQPVTHVDLIYDVPHRPAQIDVLLEDAQGTWLPDAFYGVHTWNGDDAVIAQARFLSEGATPELMRTAELHDSMYAGADRFLDASPDTFTIIESCFHDCGPTYGGCLLRANQHRGEVRITLAPRTVTGSLQIDVRDSHGNKVTPLWIRMNRLPAIMGLPVPVPGRQTTWVPPSDISGRWNTVPESGRIDDLPIGELTVEILPGPELVKGRLKRCPNPVLKQCLTIAANTTSNFVGRTEVGVPLILELRLPPVAANERLHYPRTQVHMTPIDSGRTKLHNLQPLDGSRRVKFVDGRCLTRCLGTFLPGKYQLHYAPRMTLQRRVPGDGKKKAGWKTVPSKWNVIDVLVELRPGMEPIVLQMRML